MSSCDSSLVVGGGAMAANHHVPRLLRLLQCERVVIFEIDEYRRRQLEIQFAGNKSIEIRGTVPGDEHFDLIIIATPPKFHFQYFAELSSLSDRFLVEKPLTINAAEALQLEELAIKQRKMVFVNLIRRSFKSYPLIREFVRKQHFGPLKEVVVNEGGVFDWKAVSMGSFSRELNGGGVLMDTGPHTLDLLFQIFDELFVQECRMDGRTPAVEANCQLRLLGDGQIPIRLGLSRNRCLSNTLKFIFEQADLAVSVMGEIMEVEEKNRTRYQIIPEGALPSVGWPKVVDEFYRQFLIEGDNRGVGPPESAKIAHVIDQAYAVAEYVYPEF